MSESTYELITSRRTIRQFRPKRVGRPLLKKLINAARLAPSASNLQPLEFMVVDDSKTKRLLFPCLRWAAYITPRGDPKPGQEPAAYIVTLVNLSIRQKMFEYDIGAAVENMILAAAEEGVGACWMLSIERGKIAPILDIPSGFRIDCVLALGYPAEKPVMEEERGSVKYWKDEREILHVPKRSLKSIIHFNRFP